jgi:Uma2 family endonuclease
MQLTEKQYYTPEEYLELEANADYKSEYIEGKIIPMAGASINHNRISLNLSSALNFAFKNQNYEVFMGDIRLWIPERLIYTYLDVIVIANEPEFYQNRNDTITNPQIIIEVLSPSTKGYDRENKFQSYRTIPSFQEYLLIDQNRIYVEHFSKTGIKKWNLFEYDQEDEKICFVTVDFEISLQDLYNKVKFENPES